MEEDTDLEDLREEVEKLSAITADTNRQIHKMRRGIWWGRIWTVVWWIIIFGASGYAYYYFLQPIVLRAEGYYTQFQHQAGQTQTVEGQVAQFFSQLIKPTQQAPVVPASGQQ